MARIPFDPDAIEMLARLLKRTGLSEIELQEKESRIRLSRVSSRGREFLPDDDADAVPHDQAIRVEQRRPLPQQDAVPPGAVVSPTVGVIYLSPDPASPPFVAAGSKVAAGATLMLIESMKTFTPITAERDGTVSRVLIDSGEAVEFGQPLMIIE